MPTEDPRRDDPRRDGLRIGGWLEMFAGRRALPGRPPLVTPPPSRVPVFRPLRPRSPQRRPIARPVAGFARVENPRQVRLRIALTCLAATAVGTAAVAVLADRAGTAAPVAQMSVADPVTLGAMPPPSSAAPSAPKAVPPPKPSSHAPATSRSPVARHAPDAVHRPTTARPVRPVVGGLRVGATVRLGLPADVARYRNPFDAFGSRFVVRCTASAGCVAFESAGQPGSFLRHRDFILRLEPTDNSALFRLDSAFCPVPSVGGTFRLRSVNYPDRFLTVFRSAIYLAPVPPDRATAFTAN